MYMFVVLSILAFHGELKIVEPVFNVDKLTLEQCVAHLKNASSKLDTSVYELRCVKIGEVF
jgi:hypothetical protein